MGNANEDTHIEQQEITHEEDNGEDKPVDPRLASLQKFFDKDQNQRMMKWVC